MLVIFFTTRFCLFLPGTARRLEKIYKKEAIKELLAEPLGRARPPTGTNIKKARVRTESAGHAFLLILLRIVSLSVVKQQSVAHAMGAIDPDTRLYFQCFFQAIDRR